MFTVTISKIIYCPITYNNRTSRVLISLIHLYFMFYPKGYNPVHHTIPNINIIQAEQFIGRVAFIPHKYSAIIQVLL